MESKIHESPELLTDILRAEANGNDLLEDNMRIIVCAEKLDVTLYEIGSASCELLVSKHINPRQVIEKIKFSPRGK